MTETAVEASEATAEETPEGAAERSPAEGRSPMKLFAFSEYLHLGEGAEECEHGEDGRCKDGTHFHAWCRLPNQLQEEEMRKKAQAAKARVMRQLRDPESDGFAILEGEMDTLRNLSDAKAHLIEELVNRERIIHMREAALEVEEDERWENIDEDRERLRVLHERGETGDEIRELQKHVGEYQDALKAEQEKQEQPLRAALEEKDLEELLLQIRNSRIEAEGMQEFMRVWSLWEWYIGTLQPRPKEKGFPVERVWSNIAQLMAAPNEVIDALDNLFGRLERQQRTAGNSS